MHTVCNGRNDCPNGEDEKDCRPLSCPGFLKCRTDGVCVHPHDLSAKHVICKASRDDKTHQGMIACPRGCHCTGNAALCKNIELRFPVEVRIFARTLVYRNVICRMASSCWERLTSTRFLINLEMSRCELRTMDLTHLRGLVYLKIFKITYNNIKTIGKQFFQDMTNLEVIDLRHNSLTIFGDDVFSQTNVIRILRLDHNSIRTIAEYAFARPQQLEVLTLSYNNIGSLGENIQFGNAAFLKEVNISHNPVVHIDHTILIQVFQDLSLLDSAPIRLCCLLESIKKCYPQISQDRSLCLRLIPSVLQRVIFWLLGFVLLFSIFISIAWFVLKQLPEARSLINILSLFLFVSDGLTATYFLTMAIVDIVMSPRFALYEAHWRSILFAKC